jgi:hypothetical protein
MGWEVVKERNSICRKKRNGGAEISIEDTVMLHHPDTLLYFYQIAYSDYVA